MGDTFQTVVDRDAAPRGAPRLARSVVDRWVAEGIVLADVQPGVGLSDLQGHPPGPHWHKAVDDARRGAPEGVVVHTERHVFHSTFHGRDPSTSCPRCAAVAEDSLLLSEAVARRHRTGEADIPCHACGETSPLPSWHWSDDHLAFGHLGFEFWNWPSLSEEFRARTAESLPGHRTAFLAGRI
ncbi:hypothetical protein PYK79_31880 [Streptomyces sp. ID05-04B]|jgi:hypothetical protein|uniref:hypothetical protein n=1 Tax=unclassified Streptomyces TaxID=2593676 RepID=UPI000D1A9A1A|nr:MULTISPECIES: hypothetical protein [unclassified Streptomyces]AVV42040.1 hypothetical protein C6376_11990 [Streptomyces sp. P3]MDX5566934.1 hypothetical protein [Streptomyces sp. ID05-04B]